MIDPPPPPPPTTLTTDQHKPLSRIKSKDNRGGGIVVGGGVGGGALSSSGASASSSFVQSSSLGNSSVNFSNSPSTTSTALQNLHSVLSNSKPKSKKPVSPKSSNKVVKAPTAPLKPPQANSIIPRSPVFKDPPSPSSDSPLESPTSKTLESPNKTPRVSNGNNPPMSLVDDEIVYLNIGGHHYTTKKSTLCGNPEKPNYFNSLLEGVFPVTRDRKGYIFIDRPGKYFEPILEYLITGEVNIPRDLSVPALVKEAAFYCIDFPLDETHESLSFVTDSWLLDRFENRAYLKIAPIADSILTIVLKQFKEKADKSIKIETRPFLIKDQTTVNYWLDNLEGGREYRRFEFIDQQKKLYSNGSIVNDEFFTLLDDPENRTTIINYCFHNELTLDIVPVTLNFPGMTGEKGSFIFGYKFVHLMYHNHSLVNSNNETANNNNNNSNTSRNDRRKYFRRISVGRDASRIDSDHG